MLDRVDVATPAARMSPPRFTEPTRPCSRCGAVARIHRYEAATLRMLGRPPTDEASRVKWCGPAQRVRFEPDGEGWFREVAVTSDAGLLLPRELDERLGLNALVERHLVDPRTGRNSKFPLADLLK